MDRAVDISGRQNLSLLCIMVGSLLAISGLAVGLLVGFTGVGGGSDYAPVGLVFILA